MPQNHETPGLHWSTVQRQLTIDERLLEAMQWPQSLALGINQDGSLILVHSHDPRAGQARKVNYPNRAHPRLKIGAMSPDAARLQEGRYTAFVYEQAIYASQGGIIVSLETSPHGAAFIAMTHEHPAVRMVLPFHDAPLQFDHAQSRLELRAERGWTPALQLDAPLFNDMCQIIYRRIGMDL